jgi:uncharacterized peroxidase-related enzyme
MTIDPATATGKAKEIFEGPLKGKHFNLFKAMANSPVGLDFYLQNSGVLSHGLLNAKEREVVQLAVAESNKCGYCAAAHTALGKGAGLSDASALGARRGHVEGDAKLDALARFARAVNERKGMIAGDDLAKFKSAGYSDGAVVEVVAGVAAAVYTNYLNSVNETVIDFPAVPAV